MAVILEAMPFCSTWGERKYRIEPIKSLDRRLLIDTENRSVLRRMKIEADDVGCLLLELRVVGKHVTADPVRLQTRSSPCPGNQHVIDPERLRQSTRTPVSRPVGGTTAGPREDPRLQLGRQHPHRGSRIPRVESGDTSRLKPLLPATDVSRRTAQRLLNGQIRFTLSKHQNQPRSPRIFGPSLPRANARFQLTSLGRSDGQRHAPSYH